MQGVEKDVASAALGRAARNAEQAKDAMRDDANSRSKRHA